MSFKKLFFTLGAIPLIPIFINHFNIEIKNKEELFKSVDHIKKGTKGIIKFTYDQIKEILEGE
jgi:hypothetical protein